MFTGQEVLSFEPFPGALDHAGILLECLGSGSGQEVIEEGCAARHYAFLLSFSSLVSTVSTEFSAGCV